MLDSRLRPLKDWALRRIAGPLGRRVHPNIVSLFAFLPGLLAAWMLLEGRNYPALGLWLLNRVLDGLDGAAARESGRASDFGAYLDIMLDFILYAFLPLAMVLYAPWQGAAGTLPDARLLLAALVMMAAFYVNAASWMFLAAILEKNRSAVKIPAEAADRDGGSTGIVMPPGIVEGTETIILFSLMMVLPSLRVLLFSAMAVLTLLSALLRMLWAWRTMGRKR